MHPAATLFLDVAVQGQLWPDGAWPLVREEQAGRIARLFAIAAGREIRQGGVVCRHLSAGSDRAPFTPLHCASAHAADERPAECLPLLPLQVWTAEIESDRSAELDRAHAIYVDSGCGAGPENHPVHARVFTHLISGIRDAVVFGAGVEYGIDRVVDALLRRRIRTHVALDAMAAADEIVAQTIVASWKRRGADGVTVEMVDRMLRCT